MEQRSFGWTKLRVCRTIVRLLDFISPYELQVLLVTKIIFAGDLGDYFDMCEYLFLDGQHAACRSLIESRGLHKVSGRKIDRWCCLYPVFTCRQRRSSCIFSDGVT
jgi:hypothetical protein